MSMRTRLMKPAAALLGAGLLAMTTLAGASAQNAVTLNGVKSLPDEHYVMVTFLSGIEFWKPARQGMEQAAAQLGVKAIYQGTEEYDATDEARVLDQVIAGNPTGILVTAQNPDALRPTIDKAIDAGVSLVTFDSDSPKSKRPVFLAGDNYRIGRKAGDTMIKLLGGKKGAKVLVVTTIGQLNMEQRANGFSDGVKAAGLEVVRTVEEGGSYENTYARTKEVLQAVPDLAGIFDCGSMAPGAAKAVAEAGKTGEIKIIGMDLDAALLDLIGKGQVQATMAQGAWNMGYWGMMMSYALAHGMVNAGIANWKDAGISPLPSYVDTGSYEVTKANLEAFKMLGK
ncbi:MAG: substrate-binding domain-containing protein [Roseiarcus sp.]